MTIGRFWFVTASLLAVGSCQVQGGGTSEDSDGSSSSDDEPSNTDGEDETEDTDDERGSGGGPTSGAGGSTGSSPGAGGYTPIDDESDCGPGNTIERDEDGNPIRCVRCPDDKWDHDQKSSNTCVIKVDCFPGSFVVDEGSPTTNRVCEQCAGGYTTVNNEPVCTPWPLCPAGTTTGGVATTRADCIQATHIGVSLSGACALFENGALWCWGEYPNREPDPLTDAYPYLPEHQPRITGMETLEVGYAGSSCGITAAKTVKCWGAGNLGSAIDSSFTPSEAVGVTDAVQVSVGYGHTCALSEDGLVRCWGDGGDGALGTDPADDREPGVVTGISGVTAIGSGRRFSCGLVSGGKVRCWGINDNGELGAGIPDPESFTPVEVLQVSGAEQLAVGYQHSCVIIQGEVSCWGSNEHGVLGRAPTDFELAAKVPGLSGVAKMRSGSRHNCAILTSGEIKCWGLNESGQLGDGTEEDSYTPVTVVGIDDAVDVALRDDFTCAILEDGSIQCWGNNYRGALGIGNKIESSSTPMYVVGAP